MAHSDPSKGIQYGSIVNIAFLIGLLPIRLSTAIAISTPEEVTILPLLVNTDITT